jgi:hypothetical protein
MKKQVTKDVLLKFKTSSIQLNFPEKCVYCNAPAETKIERKADHKQYRLGNYRLELAEKYRLPYINDTQYRGFKIYAYKQNYERFWFIYWDLKAEIPYCKKHYEIMSEIERAAFSLKWSAIGGIVGGAINFALFFNDVLGFVGYVFIFFVGFFIGAFLGNFAHKLFDKSGPAEKKDYLKNSSSYYVPWKGHLGLDFIILENRYIEQFCEDPFIVVKCRFINPEYADSFAKINADIIIE